MHQRPRIIQNLTNRCKLIRVPLPQCVYCLARFQVRKKTCPLLTLPCLFHCPAHSTTCCLIISVPKRAAACACRLANNKSAWVSWWRSAKKANCRAMSSKPLSRFWTMNRCFPPPSGACCCGRRTIITIPLAMCCFTRCRFYCVKESPPAPRPNGSGLPPNRGWPSISTP